MCFQWNALHVVYVQIHEIAAQRTGKLPQAHRLDDGLGVTIHRRTVPDENLCGSQAQKAFPSGRNDGRMGVHNSQRIQADKIRFQQDSLTFDRKTEDREALVDQRSQILLIAGRTPNHHAGRRTLKGGNESLVAHG